MLTRFVAGIAGTILIACPIAACAQQEAPASGAAAVDQALFDKGKQLFEDNCSTCHQVNGVGSPPDFPALAGNDRLTDLSLIVGNVHQGKGAMPAFADFTADDIAALATYVRNAWDNKFGGATPDAVATLLGGMQQASAGTSIWQGVGTADQAARGDKIYSAACSKCHGRTANGVGDPEFPRSPAIARFTFLTKWKGQSVDALFEYMRTAMPQDHPGSLSDQDYVDVIAHLLALSKVPAADKELATDPAVLAGLLIEPPPQ